MGADPPAVLGNDVSANPYIIIPAATVAAFSFIGIIGNTGDLLSQRPSRKGGYFGVVTGTLSLTFAYLLSEYDPVFDETGPYLGIAGVVALGLGALSLHLARERDRSTMVGKRIEFVPSMLFSADGPKAGISVRFRF